MNEENELETTTKCEREKERKYKKGIIRSEVKKKKKKKSVIVRHLEKKNKRNEANSV